MKTIIFKPNNFIGMLFDYNILSNYKFKMYSDEHTLNVFNSSLIHKLFIIENDNTVISLSHPIIDQINPWVMLDSNIKQYIYKISCKSSVRITDIDFVNNLKLEIL